MPKKKKAAKRAKATAREAPARKPARGPKRARVEAVPARYGTATPHLIVSPCAQAMEFYRDAFGAKLLPPMLGPGGVVMHAEMKIGDSIVMLADELPPQPGMDLPRKSPRTVGATTGGVMLYVKNVDALFERAVAAGARGVMPPADMFWGDRYGQVEDPFGHVWAIATHKRDVSMAQMKKAMATMPAPEEPTMTATPDDERTERFSLPGGQA